MSSKKSSKKPVAKVTRKFLNDLADDIYNPKTRKFLRLCNGKLVNGPDPTNMQRPMHCGLGELYFAMTGEQPNVHPNMGPTINEDKVVALAVEQSGFDEALEKKVNDAVAQVKSLDLPKALKNDMISELVDGHDSLTGKLEEAREEFEEILSNIPEANDTDDDDNGSYEEYRNRACRVATQLRRAAKLLPE